MGCPYCGVAVPESSLGSHLVSSHLGSRGDGWECGRCPFAAHDFDGISAHCIQTYHNARAIVRRREEDMIRLLAETQDRRRRIDTHDADVDSDRGRISVLSLCKRRRHVSSSAHFTDRLTDHERQSTPTVEPTHAYFLSENEKDEFVQTLEGSTESDAIDMSQDICESKWVSKNSEESEDQSQLFQLLEQPDAAPDASELETVQITNKELGDEIVTPMAPTFEDPFPGETQSEASPDVVPAGLRELQTLLRWDATRLGGLDPDAVATICKEAQEPPPLALAFLSADSIVALLLPANPRRIVVPEEWTATETTPTFRCLAKVPAACFLVSTANEAAQKDILGSRVLTDLGRGEQKGFMKYWIKLGADGSYTSIRGRNRKLSMPQDWDYEVTMILKQGQEGRVERLIAKVTGVRPNLPAAAFCVIQARWVDGHEPQELIGKPRKVNKPFYQKKLVTASRESPASEHDDPIPGQSSCEASPDVGALIVPVGLGELQALLSCDNRRLNGLEPDAVATICEAAQEPPPLALAFLSDEVAVALLLPTSHRRINVPDEWTALESTPTFGCLARVSAACFFVSRLGDKWETNGPMSPLISVSTASEAARLDLLGTRVADSLGPGRQKNWKKYWVRLGPDGSYTSFGGRKSGVVEDWDYEVTITLKEGQEGRVERLLAKVTGVRPGLPEAAFCLVQARWVGGHKPQELISQPRMAYKQSFLKKLVMASRDAPASVVMASVGASAAEARRLRVRFLAKRAAMHAKGEDVGIFFGRGPVKRRKSTS